MEQFRRNKIVGTQYLKGIWKLEHVILMGGRKVL